MLIETAELEARLGEAALRIIDCNMVFQPRPDGGYEFESGQSQWRDGHIPGSVYLDFERHLSAPHPTLRFMMPSAERFARILGEHGIGDDHQVVVYSRGGNFWATRLYLMFREYGCDRVSVLNGGWDRWQAEGRVVSQAAPDWPPAVFSPGPPRGLFVNRDAVAAAMDDPDTCLINALSPELHSGAKFNPAYGRRGHIPGSCNLYCMELIDPDTRRFLDRDQLADRFGPSRALQAARVITYCGGGISATTDAFALLLLGHPQVHVYDGSLTDWGNHPDLPMATD
ncbi:MAG: sulfurtransferase [Xanthomonadales bacterium]|nr:sulfurtransferase [Xanthomonadales bacterium]